MKKTIVFLGLALMAATTSFAQHQPVRLLAAPQTISLPGDTSIKVAVPAGDSIGITVTSHDNNGIMCVFSYSVVDKRGKAIGAPSTYRCKGDCYTYYHQLTGVNAAYQVVADSALHVQIIQP